MFEGDVLVGEVSYREPEFDAGQLALLLAWEKLQAAKTPHGVPMDVATDPANQFNFHVEGPTVDWAAHWLGVMQDSYYKQYPDANRAGHLWSVRLKD